MKKSKLFKTILIPTLGISTMGIVTTVATSCGEQPKPSTYSVSGGSLSLLGKQGTAGSDKKQWVLKKDGKPLTEGVTWSIVEPVSGVSITDGKVSWTKVISSGTHKFKVAADYNNQTYTSEDITLTIDDVYRVQGLSKQINVITNHSNYDEGNNWLLIIIESGKAITEGVTWELVATEGSSVPNWIKLNENNEISWTNAVDGIYKFYIQASYDEKIFTSSSPFIINVNIDEYDSLEITPDKDGTFEVTNYGDNNPNLLYSFDESNWNEYSEKMNIQKGQTLYLRGNNSNGWSRHSYSYSQFRITGDISVSGNIMALLDNGAKAGEEGDIVDIPCDYCFINLFGDCAELKNVDEYLLPASTLKSYCYYQMFENCTSLTKAPALPAITLTEACYSSMFENCTSLTKAPELPAMILPEKCYFEMFRGCSSLLTPPSFENATIVFSECCKYMFADCTSLMFAPGLPAPVMAEGCYYGMFQDCTRLVTADYIGAVQLEIDCFIDMFYNCHNLLSVKIYYVGEWVKDYFFRWVTYVASSGIFYYNGDALTPRAFGFPEAWEIESF